MKSILFYISGHGYGHAVRAGEVMRSLMLLRPEWRILARTRAPRWLLPDGIEYSEAEFESGVVESKAGVVMDEHATLRNLRELLLRWNSLVATETQFAVEQRIDLIVADIPPMAGDVAHSANIPCVAISNFTWDWIYEPYASDCLDRLEQGYARMSVLLRLPFYQTERLDVFPRIVDAPLIARRSPSLPRHREQRLQALLGSRAQISPEAMAQAIRSAPEFDLVSAASGSSFTETLGSCDLVVAKLGFSMLAECIANRKPLLYPPRENFREESLLQAHVGKHIPSLAIPHSDFYTGDWGPYLRELMSQPVIESDLRIDGAEFCGNFIADWLA